MTFKNLLIAGTALASLITPGVAYADEAASADAADQPSSVGTGATSDGEEIIVTARRRQETAQQVPLAISVIGGEHIDATGSFNVGRLQQLTPSLQFYSSNPRNSFVNIRGIGAPFGLTNDGIEQGVGIYVDDVYYSRAASSTFDFLDVAQIELLRGPQGTLYGKNTTAGAINITTRAPTFDFDARAEVTIGSLGFKQAKAAVSGPLSDTIAARVAVSSTSRRGTIYNVTSGNWINEQDNLGLRLQLLWKPTSDLEVTLAGDYNKQDPECCGTVFVRVGATQRPIHQQYEALIRAQDYAPVSRNPFDRLTDLDSNMNAGNIVGGASLRVKWNLGAGTLTSVTAWRFWDWKPENDRDFTGLPATTRSQNPSQQNQYTQEIRYAQSGRKLDFVVGAFAFHQKIDTQGLEQQGPAASRWSINPGNDPSQWYYNGVLDPVRGCALTSLACTPEVLDGLTAINTQGLTSTSVALFGQVSWKVTDRFTIQPGIRINYDKKSGLYHREVFDGNGDQVLASTPGDWAAAQRAVYGLQSYKPSGSNWNFSYDLTLSYKPADNVLAYATYAKTFKSFGINQNGVPSPLVETIKPERVNHWEIGLKSQFWDRRATLNLSAYLTDIADFQATVNNGAVSTTRGFLANAEKVRSQGFEADFSLRPSERFSFYVNGAYTDAKFVKFDGAPCPPELSGGGAGTLTNHAPEGVPGLSPPYCDISGSPLPGVSKWSLSYGAEYNVPAQVFGEDGQFYFGIDGNYRSRFSSNPSPSRYTWIEGYALTNLRAGFRTASGFDIYGWVRNAFDVQYFQELNVPSGQTGLITGIPGDQRTFGGTIKAVF